MISRLRTIGLSALETFSIDVEVVTRPGERYFAIIGLGDIAVKEAKERVLASLSQSGFTFPDQILVNLAPAEIKKEGASFDVAIALGILHNSGQVPSSALDGRLFLGELTLDGSIRPIKGVLTLVLGLKPGEVREVIVPSANLAEATLLSTNDVVGVGSLSELVQYLKSGILPSQDLKVTRNQSPRIDQPSLAQVWGQEVAKRALTIAVAGGHNILLVGPPGCGKSMLAQRFSSLMPAPSQQQTIEMVSIHSAMGNDVSFLIEGGRPFRAPHHTISEAGLIGGGSTARPGEITLSHGGVLFLDEFPEFRRSSIEALRAPLEGGQVTISRAKMQRTFPAAFQLVAAMNPCPCGKFGYGKGKQSCLCSSQQIQKYLGKLSFPILERIDLQVELEPVALSVLTKGMEQQEVASVDYVALVQIARAQQQARGVELNAHLDSDKLREHCRLTAAVRAFFEDACTKLDISARGFVRLLRVARTIADLDQQATVDENHLAEALSYRALSRIHASIGTKTSSSSRTRPI